jgi:hypothetical protein
MGKAFKLICFLSEFKNLIELWRKQGVVPIEFLDMEHLILIEVIIGLVIIIFFTSTISPFLKNWSVSLFQNRSGYEDVIVNLSLACVLGVRIKKKPIKVVFVLSLIRV